MPTAIHPFISISKVPVLISVTFEIIARGKRTKKGPADILFCTKGYYCTHFTTAFSMVSSFFYIKCFYNSVGLSVKRFMLI